MPEWSEIEVTGRTVEGAVEVALTELGIDSVDAVEVEVVQEPQRGFLGMGGRDAIVKVRPKPAKSRKRRRRRSHGKGKGEGPDQKGDDRKPEPGRRPQKDEKERSRGAGERKGSSTRGDAGSKPRGAGQAARGSAPRSGEGKRNDREEPGVTADINEQAQVVEDFLRGLVDAFGFEGEVRVRVEDDVILADVEGPETEALVGEKGSVMQAVLELARTVVQRKTQESARIRLDVAGYGERRREALRIYAGRLAERVLEEGGEIMLEPMNAADRKTVHDRVAEIDGVRTFSEGEEPRRSVVIATDQ
jgi:spoIIIJ-associated protein